MMFSRCPKRKGFVVRFRAHERSLCLSLLFSSVGGVQRQAASAIISFEPLPEGSDSRTLTIHYGPPSSLFLIFFNVFYSFQRPFLQREFLINAAFSLPADLQPHQRVSLPRPLCPLSISVSSRYLQVVSYGWTVLRVGSRASEEGGGAIF